MPWPSRKKPTPEPAPAQTRPEPTAFHCVIELGDTKRGHKVSSELVEQLVQAIREPALTALDRRFAGESWCSKVETAASLEGPTISFILDLAVPPGETMASMNKLVNDEFGRRWNAAAQQLLT
jgi:hypothetical protein